MITQQPPQRLVSLKEAAAFFNVHPATLRRWTQRGILPDRRTPGGHRIFLESDLQELRDKMLTDQNQLA